MKKATQAVGSTELPTFLAPRSWEFCNICNYDLPFAAFSCKHGMPQIWWSVEVRARTTHMITC
eukprot:6208916-Pleurochrysis_carterae.AAC.1